jgi:trigger factor
MTLQVKETKTEGLKREFKISVPAKDIEARIGDRLSDLARSAHLPGFRPGKAPLTVLKRKFGDAVRGEVLERALGDSSRQAMSERGIRPATQLNIEVTAFGDGKDLEYTLSLDVMPEIKPMDFSKLTLERLVVPVDEAKVMEALQRIAASRKSTKPAPAGHAAAKGDVVVMDFVGRVEGREFPGGKAEGYSLELGSGSFVPGFEDQLFKAKAGAKLTVKIAFPKDYAAADLAGKDAEFDVTVKDIQLSEPAAVDDALAKAVGLADLEALKARIREEQGREYKEISRLRLKRRLLDGLSAAHDFEVPPTVVENEFNAIWRQFEQQRAQAKEGKATDAEAVTDAEKNKTDDEHKADFRTIAERRVRLGLLFAEVGRLNNIQVSQEDINRALVQQAQRFPGQEQAVVEHFRKNPEALQSLMGPILEDKVTDFILEMAKIKDKPATLDDLLKPDDEDNDGRAAGAAKKPKKKTAK